MEALDPVHEEMVACCAIHEPKLKVVPLAPADFYNRVRAAHTVVQTSEPRLYGNNHPAQGRDLSLICCLDDVPQMKCPV